MCVCLALCGHRFQQIGPQPCLPAVSPACGQLDRANKCSLSPFVPEILVSRDNRFGRPVPSQPAHSPHLGWVWCLLLDSSPSSRFPCRIYTVRRHHRSGHPRVHQVTQIIAYRCRSAPRVRRHRASSSHGSSSDWGGGCNPMDKIICISFFPTPTTSTCPFYFILCISMGFNVLTNPTYWYCNVAILPVVTKDLPISPRFSPEDFLSRCKFSTLSLYNSPTNNDWILLTHVLTLFAMDVRIKTRFDKNQTHEFRTTSRCARLPTRPLGRRGYSGHV